MKQKRHRFSYPQLFVVCLLLQLVSWTWSTKEVYEAFEVFQPGPFQASLPFDKGTEKSSSVFSLHLQHNDGFDPIRRRWIKALSFAMAGTAIARAVPYANIGVGALSASGNFFGSRSSREEAAQAARVRSSLHGDFDDFCSDVSNGDIKQARVNENAAANDAEGNGDAVRHIIRKLNVRVCDLFLDTPGALDNFRRTFNLAFDLLNDKKYKGAYQDVLRAAGHDLIYGCLLHKFNPARLPYEGEKWALASVVALDPVDSAKLRRAEYIYLTAFELSPEGFRERTLYPTFVKVKLMAFWGNYDESRKLAENRCPLDWPNSLAPQSLIGLACPMIWFSLGKVDEAQAAARKVNLRNIPSDLGQNHGQSVKDLTFGFHEAAKDIANSGLYKTLEAQFAVEPPLYSRILDLDCDVLMGHESAFEISQTYRAAGHLARAESVKLQRAA